MIEKGKPTNKVVRMFRDEYSKTAHKTILRWNRLDPIEKRVSASSHETLRANLVKVTDIDKKISITSYFLTPRVTFNSAFIQSRIEWCICYSRVTKRLYIDGVRDLKIYLNTNGGVRDLLTKLGVEAFVVDQLNQEGSNAREGMFLGNLINKVTLKAIITGNCTNLNDLVTRYFKSVGIKHMNLKKYRLYIEKSGGGNSAYLDLRCCKNMDNLFSYLNGPKPYKRSLIEDAMDMAIQLQRTIDFKWTERRLTEEHDEMVKTISKIKIQCADTTPIDYFEIDKPEVPGMTLLTTSRDLVQESEELQHCVGTSSTYLNKMKSYNVLLFRYDKPKFRGTVEVYIDGSPSWGWGSDKKEKQRIRVSQIQGFKNKKVDNETKQDVVDLLHNEYNPFITELQDLLGYDFDNSPKGVQERVFVEQVAVVEEFDLPF